MNKRKPISAKKRFDILERDNFTCQSCGAKQSDDVLLEVDHIKPVSKGGTNDIDNLVTLCYKCNRGKGARILGEKQSVKLEESRVDEMHKKMQQRQAYIKYKEKLNNADEQHHKKIVKIVNDLINNHFNRNSIYVSKYSLKPAQMNKLYIYQKKHGVEKLIDSIFENEHMLIPETIEQDKDLRESINQFNFGLFYNEIFRKLDIKKETDKPTVTSCIKYLGGILYNRLCDYDSWEYSRNVRNATREIPTNENKIKFFEEYAHPHAKEIIQGSEYNDWYAEYMNISHEFLKKL
jgi:hypothetical protein